MSSDFDSLQGRGRALEEAFFHERDRQLIDALKRKFTSQESEQVLAAAIGIGDELTIKAMTRVEAGIEVLVVMAILPMVEVAWCDGEVSSTERIAVLKGAAQMDVGPENPGYQLLERWLEQRPNPAAVEAWKKYVAAIVGTMEPATARQVCEKIMGRAERVARAAGGFLGFGSKISPEEQACLDDLTKAFGLPS